MALDCTNVLFKPMLLAEEESNKFHTWTNQRCPVEWVYHLGAMWKTTIVSLSDMVLGTMDKVSGIRDNVSGIRNKG
jgi:hypothetical protein